MHYSTVLYVAGRELAEKAVKKVLGQVEETAAVSGFSSGLCSMGDRGIIESNPIIARKYREMKKKIHLRKMRNMKSSLDTRSHEASRSKIEN